MNDDARLWHPWLRLNRVRRVILHTNWTEIGSRMTLLADLDEFVHDHRPHGGVLTSRCPPE